MSHFLFFYSPPFPPPSNSPKNQNFKKMKKNSGDTLFYTSILKIMIVSYTVHEIWRATDVIVIVDFGLFFALLPPSSTKIQNFIKMKKSLEIPSFYICVPKIMIGWCIIPEIWCATVGQMDRRKKWHIEVGSPHKKEVILVLSPYFTRID